MYLSEGIFKLRLGALIPRSVGRSVGPPKNTNFVPNFFYIVEEVIEVDDFDEGNVSAAAGK